MQVRLEENETNIEYLIRETKTKSKSITCPRDIKPKKLEL